MELLTEFFNDVGGSLGAKERFCCCSVLVKFNLETLYTIRSFFYSLKYEVYKIMLHMYNGYTGEVSIG